MRLGEDDHPPVTGLVARYRRRDFFVSRWRVTEFGERGVQLNSDILDLRPFARRENEVLLARDVLDKQLIDVDGKRVVRVNDVQLIDAANEWRVTGADVSFLGLWRRLTPHNFVGTRRPVEVIDWADVGYLATDVATVQLKSSRKKLARLHPVEIARLAEALSYHHGSEIVESLDDETAAETLEEMPAERQARIIDDMVINGLLLPVIQIAILRLVNNRELMGAHVNGAAYNIAAWLTTTVVSVLSLLLILTTLFPNIFRIS